MKKPWMKVVVLAGVYLLSLIIFNFITNKANKDLTASMPEANLPVINFIYNDEAINELHGYVSEMDITAMRDTITPVDDSRELQLHISTYGERVDKITYEIRSLDSTRFLADGEIEDFTISGRTIDETLKVQNLLEAEEEYSLRIALEIKGQKIYYYTRLMQTTKCNVKECLDFARTFHDYTFSENAADFIPTYMDKASGDATTLNYVDLSCTLRQITWNKFEGTILQAPTISLHEVNATYVGIIMRYTVFSVNSSNETEYYNIEEYYRLRYTPTRMYVMNFERTMNQIFRGENSFIYNGTDIQLGIRDRNVEYSSTEGGDIVAFVQEGELWIYNVNTKEIQQVFSFRDVEGRDSRNNWNQHDINIARVDEAGSVDFIVYGYMNRGIHEGEVGISICHYDGIAHTVEEEAFIPYLKSFALLKAEMGQLMYQNEKGVIYFMIEGNVYSFDINSLTLTEIISDLKEGTYASSPANKFFAWIDSSREYSSPTISLLDLSSGQTITIQKGENEYLRPLGFIGEDFIYGIADADDVIVSMSGAVSFNMKALEILDTSEDKMTVLKTYQVEDKFISGIVIENYTIDVNLIQVAEDGTVTASTDKIKNRNAGNDEITAITTTRTDIKETEVQISLKKKSSASKIKMITSTIVLLDEPRTINLPVKGEVVRYYVYNKGKVILSTDSISEAIITANANSAIVVNQNQHYIWTKAKASSVKAFKNIAPNEADLQANSIVQSVSAMLEYKGKGMNVESQVEAGSTPKHILETTLKDSTVLDLTGCSVNEVLYYISNGYPVFASTSSDTAVLLIGYSSSNIHYYNPQIRETETISLADANKKFQAAGNVFFTYLDN